MAKKNYEEVSKKILELVGGVENISKFTHCATRLRFTVKDKDLVNEEEIKKIDMVIGARWTGEQLQIIIGNAVGDVYSTICRISGLKEEAAIDENLDAHVTKKLTIKGVFNNIVAYISGSAYLMITLLAGVSIFATLNGVLGPNFLNLYSADSDIYILFDFMYNAVFYFFFYKLF